MKLFVVLFSIIALSLSKAVPLEPGNNSYYVEGESRYIWMPDGEGKLHLVDLQATVGETDFNSRNGADNQYWLFTRRNPTRAQIITHGNTNSLRNSYYDARNPFMVIVHGWNSRGDAEMNTQITSAYLAVTDANVIVVDWRAAASGSYTTSVVRVPSVGRFLGNFVSWVISNTGGSWNNVHLVGFSLGAHIVGNAGRTAGSRPIRITGLDPAGPQWGGNANALNRNDGQYVESIHTDGGQLGIFDPISDADFYPNGGRNPQPGCWNSNCSHSRAPQLFASSIRTDHFVGRRCADLNQARNNQCSGAAFNMGNRFLNKRGSGLYGLRTGNRWPF